MKKNKQPPLPVIHALSDSMWPKYAVLILLHLGLTEIKLTLADVRRLRYFKNIEVRFLPDDVVQIKVIMAKEEMQ